jgi:hypothetical protein
MLTILIWTFRMRSLSLVYNETIIIVLKWCIFIWIYLLLLMQRSRWSDVIRIVIVWKTTTLLIRVLLMFVKCRFLLRMFAHGGLIRWMASTRLAILATAYTASLCLQHWTFLARTLILDILYPYGRLVISRSLKLRLL